MNKSLRISILVIALAQLFAIAAPVPKDNGGWRKVLGFDVMDNGRVHKADLGNHRRVRASMVSDLGWEIEVLNYGTNDSDNLLYNGHNWHGIQPWDAFAWTKHQATYPDTREVAYDNGKSRVKIVLVDCQTRQVGSNSYEFTKGRIEVYHKP